MEWVVKLAVIWRGATFEMVQNGIIAGLKTEPR
jgi:hypothetical protein